MNGITRRILVGLFILGISGSAHAQALRIYHIDVDQGDATLFVAPSGHTLLVDSGKNEDGDRLAHAMETAGVDRIDFFVATHYDEDHYGGIDALINDHGVVVGAAFDRGDKKFLPETKTSQKTYTDYQAAIGHSSRHLMRGETIPLDAAVSVTCLSSGGVVLGEEPPEPGRDENDMSLALLVQYRGFSYWIGGDLGTRIEHKLVDASLVPDVNVYKAHHHGSDTGSSPAFLAALAPEAVIISNGNHGGYKHPRQVVLNRLAALPGPPRVLQTNKYLKGGAGGNVADEFIADLDVADDDGLIELDVDPAALTYTVNYRSLSQTVPYSIDAPATGTVVIESLLPDPAGSESVDETVTVRNTGAAAVDLHGWFLRDAKGRVWTLASVGSLAAGQSATIRRNGMPMSLNNHGDTIVLLDSANQEQDQFAYASSQPDAVIQTGH